MINVHTHSVSGPPPRDIHIVTNFPAPGLYKLWAQFQQAGKVVTVPFVLQVASPAVLAQKTVDVPPDAIRIRITQQGYSPARVEIAANRPSTLAFTRDSSAGCGGEVVFPALGIRKTIAPGGTALVPLPAQTGEIGFSCGMGMYKGMIVARIQ